MPVKIFKPLGGKVARRTIGQAPVPQPERVEDLLSKICAREGFDDHQAEALRMGFRLGTDLAEEEIRRLDAMLSAAVNLAIAKE